MSDSRDRIKQLANKAKECCRQINQKVREEEVQALTNEAIKCCNEIQSLSTQEASLT